MSAPAFPRAAVGRFHRFVLERLAIQARRQAGDPPPWTYDETLRTYSFCNVRREDDRVTRWLRREWYLPHKGDPDMVFAATVARFINLPATLEELGYPVPWYPERLARVARSREARGLTLLNGAYILSPCGHSVPYHEYLRRNLLDPMYADRTALRDMSSLAELRDWLVARPGISDFMAGQIIADVKYDVRWLSAPDWDTFVVPGPGSARGMWRLAGQDEPVPVCDRTAWGVLLAQARADLNEMLVAAGHEPLHAQDVQNCLCEFDKYERVRLDQGRPRKKFRYDPSKEAL